MTSHNLYISTVVTTFPAMEAYTATTTTTTTPTTTTPIPDTTATSTSTSTTTGRLCYHLGYYFVYYLILGSADIMTQISSNQIKWNEIVPWILIALLSVLLILSLVIHVMQAVWTTRRGISADRNLNAPPDCTLATASNPCYEASNVKLYSEAQEAVHIYETLKQ